VKTWHVLVLAGSILGGSLGGCSLIAAALAYAPGERYHYGPQQVAGQLTRIDKATGTVEVYDPGRAVWIKLGPLQSK
jgi:hypothetical protein